jgi:hypothetical protein
VPKAEPGRSRLREAPSARILPATARGLRRAAFQRFAICFNAKHRSKQRMKHIRPAERTIARFVQAPSVGESLARASQ